MRSRSSTRRSLIKEPLPWLERIESAKRPARLPVVLTREEVESILTHLSGTVGLMIRLLYGTGMRIMECVRLRVATQWKAPGCGSTTAISIDTTRSDSGFDVKLPYE